MPYGNYEFGVIGSGGGCATLVSFIFEAIFIETHQSNYFFIIFAEGKCSTLVFYKGDI